ncbi:hypothetical protein [uncultured Phycicoccus sp.]|uniref:hypothetical protein n=1 Tax=uncultured Phycicoccus sp. TaxID=661422 RepID=UPI002632933A|nr:hypothetical protein [uncultured Phycicoccus sp.]
MRRLTRAAAPLVLASLLMAGCSAAGDNAVVTQLHARNDAVARAKPFDSLVDLLPNRTYRTGDGQPWTFSSSVVVAHFTSVEPGRAYSAEDSPGGVDVPFDSPHAAWRTYHAALTVDRLVAGRALKTNERVGLSLGPDLSIEDVERDLKDLGPVLLFLDESSPVFAYDPEVLGTVWDGELIAQVGASGDLSFPALEDGEGLPFRVASIDALEAAGRTPGESITLDPSGAEVLSRKPA